jgi:sulfur carrier protein ThiS
LIIRVKITPGGSLDRSIEVDKGCTYNDILAVLMINPETVIIMVNDRPVPVDDEVSTDQVEIFSVTSRG